MVKAINKGEPLSKREEMSRHIRMLQRLHEEYEAREWQISIDSEKMSGRYILVEAMNLRTVGPVLKLAPEARTDDGWFDLVAVPPSKRAVLSAYFDARLAASESPWPVKPRRFRHLRISWDGAPLHFDDKLWPLENAPSSAEIQIMVQPSALEVLLPETRQPAH